MWNRKGKEVNKSFVIFAALAKVTEFAGGTERYYSDFNSSEQQIYSNFSYTHSFGCTPKKVYKGKLLPN